MPDQSDAYVLLFFFSRLKEKQTPTTVGEQVIDLGLLA
jgi:hypothetical protein